jgi:type 1 glutamine amidotransferase
VVKFVFLVFLSIAVSSRQDFAPTPAATNAIRFRALVLYENGGHHVAFSKAAKTWLDKLATDSSFSVDYIKTTDSITDSLLSHYQIFIQLDYPPYGWKEKAVDAFQNYIRLGKGGWVGFHHASLLGEFDGYPMWAWFSGFMGGIRYTNYIPGFARATVRVEDDRHPCLKGVPPSFSVNEEWYTYDKSPRANVHVLASVDESTYRPATTITMGDHPVVWTNEHVAARNIYIFMGHAPELLESPAFTMLFRNSIFWAAGQR